MSLLATWRLWPLRAIQGNSGAPDFEFTKPMTHTNGHWGWNGIYFSEVSDLIGCLLGNLGDFGDIWGRGLPPPLCHVQLHAVDDGHPRRHRAEVDAAPLPFRRFGE